MEEEITNRERQMKEKEEKVEKMAEGDKRQISEQTAGNKDITMVVT